MRQDTTLPPHGGRSERPDGRPEGDASPDGERASSAPAASEVPTVEVSPREAAPFRSREDVPTLPKARSAGGQAARTNIGKYRIIRTLGSGAMGSVYEVEHTFIKKRYALKLIDSGLAERPEFRERALRESRAAATIRHANIVDVSDYGETLEGAPYIVMELLDGEPLSALVRREAPMPLPLSLHITGEILQGLEAAHVAGVIHRDIKPDNVFVLAGGPRDAPRIKLLDFGISKFQETEDDVQLTQAHMVMGTPLYMSLEQSCGSKDVDARTDIYSVGVLLFQMLSGRVPYNGPSFSDIVASMTEGKRLELAEVAPDVPEPFVTVVKKAIEVRRELRYASARAMLEELEHAARACDGPRTVVLGARGPSTDGEASGQASDAPAPVEAAPSQPPAVAERGRVAGEKRAPARRRHGTAIALAAGVLALGITALLLHNRSNPTKEHGASEQSVPRDREGTPSKAQARSGAPGDAPRPGERERERERAAAPSEVTGSPVAAPREVSGSPVAAPPDAGAGLPARAASGGRPLSGMQTAEPPRNRSVRGLRTKVPF